MAKVKSSGLGLVYKQEILTGTVDGVNTVFTASVLPWDTTGKEILVMLGSPMVLGTDFTYAVVAGVGTVTFTTAPGLAQRPYAKYLTAN